MVLRLVQSFDDLGHSWIKMIGMSLVLHGVVVALLDNPPMFHCMQYLQIICRKKLYRSLIFSVLLKHGPN